MRFICQREMVGVGPGESGIWAMFEQLRQRIEAGDQFNGQFGLVVIGGLMIVISY